MPLDAMEAPTLDRRLVAILAADVEGYSRLMTMDEEAALATLSRLRGLSRKIPHRRVRPDRPGEAG
jgi:class 3 adenylate cyclase